jgi:hypothetical protein
MPSSITCDPLLTAPHRLYRNRLFKLEPVTATAAICTAEIVFAVALVAAVCAVPPATRAITAGAVVVAAAGPADRAGAPPAEPALGPRPRRTARS